MPGPIRAELAHAKGEPGRGRRDPKAPPVSPVSAGNQAMQALLRGGWVRPKLELGGIDDPEEREADAIADRVMRMPEGACCASCAGGGACEGETVRREPEARGGSATTSPRGLEQEFRHLTSGGEMLSPTLRAFFEPRLGRDLSAVRVHRDDDAEAAARAVHAKAFAVGAHVAFGAGHWAPQSPAGRRLLAHELVHTGQSGNAVRREVDIEAELGKRSAVPVESVPTRPPGTVRVQTPNGRFVYAPYGIYSVGEVPPWLHGLTMESREAHRLRYPGLSTLEIYQQHGAAAAAAKVAPVSIGDAARYAEQAPGASLRVLIANVNGAFRFLGWDASHAEGGRVAGGFVEAELGQGPTPRTGGVGAALLADRVMRALAAGNTEMELIVGRGKETARFHARLWQTIGKQGTPTRGFIYHLDTREMVRIAVAWSDALTPAARQELSRFATQEQAPSPAEVQAALARTAQARAPGTAAGSTGGTPSGTMEIGTDLPKPGTSRYGPTTRATAGGLSIIMIANEILRWMGAALQAQQAWIAQGEAENLLWSKLGAKPVRAVWDRWSQRRAPEGTEPSTSVHGAFYLPYIADIDAERLRAELPQRIQSYVELRLVIESLGAIGALQWTRGRTVAVVNRMESGGRRFYDITQAMRTVEGLTLAAAEAALRERLALRPAAERQGRILRVKPGAELLRSMGRGLFNRQPLLGAEKLLGPNAWVREIRRTGWAWGPKMLFVEPANADAHRAVALAAYVINQKIENVWKECKEGGREVHPATLPRFGDGPLRSFQAGPETTGDQRFGWTRYEIKPDNPAWTVAYGELRAFWVSESDVSVVTDDEIQAYLAE